MNFYDFNDFSVGVSPPRSVLLFIVAQGGMRSVMTGYSSLPSFIIVIEFLGYYAQLMLRSSLCWFPECIVVPPSQQTGSVAVSHPGDSPPRTMDGNGTTLFAVTRPRDVDRNKVGYQLIYSMEYMAECRLSNRQMNGRTYKQNDSTIVR